MTERTPYDRGGVHLSNFDKTAPMRFAYADPPYLGQCKKYDHNHLGYGCWNEVETHVLLIHQLYREYQDGWALSASAPSLRDLLPHCPGVRVAAWVKPFAAFKANVRNAYTWEPVIVYEGRLSSKDGAPVTRDHWTDPEALRESITMKKGLTGVKPAAFNEWVLKMLGYKPGDEFVDMFPGKGGMAVALEAAS